MNESAEQTTSSEYPSNFIGLLVAGKYRIERVVGVGEMGLVVAATHLGHGGLVALKFVHPSLQDNPVVVSGFAREASTAVRVASPHVVTVLDVGDAEPVGPFIAMELLSGHSLEEVLATRGRLSTALASEYLLQVCEGLAAIHSLGIAHRDLKPANLIVSQVGLLPTIKIVDFGVADSLAVPSSGADRVRERPVVGTPLYMSPEQFRNEAADHRSDIWSLGAILYELVSGTAAFSADSVAEVCRKVLDAQQPAPIEGLDSDVAARLDRVLRRCLAANPADRFPNVAALAAALTPFALSRAHGHQEQAARILGIDDPLADARGSVRRPAAERWGSSGGWIRNLSVFGACLAAVALFRAGQCTVQRQSDDATSATLSALRMGPGQTPSASSPLPGAEPAPRAGPSAAASPTPEPSASSAPANENVAKSPIAAPAPRPAAAAAVPPRLAARVPPAAVPSPSAPFRLLPSASPSPRTAAGFALVGEAPSSIDARPPSQRPAGSSHAAPGVR